MNAIISNGDYTASIQLPVERKQLAGALSYLGKNHASAVERKQLAGALSYLGKNHASAYDIKYNEESDQGLSFTLERRCV